MMSINAVKAVEIGAGMEVAGLRGEDNADEMRMGNNGEEVYQTMPEGFSVVYPLVKTLFGLQ